MTWPGTTSNRSPRTNFSLAARTTSAYAPGVGCGGSSRGRGAGCRLGPPRQAPGAHAADLEVVRHPRRRLALAVHHDHLVGEVKDEVALVGRALDGEPDRLELERQVVAERAVQAQVRVRPGEKIADGAQRGEDGGLAGCAPPRRRPRRRRGRRPRRHRGTRRARRWRPRPTRRPGAAPARAR